MRGISCKKNLGHEWVLVYERDFASEWNLVYERIYYVKRICRVKGIWCVNGTCKGFGFGYTHGIWCAKGIYCVKGTWYMKVKLIWAMLLLTHPFNTDLSVIITCSKISFRSGCRTCSIAAITGACMITVGLCRAHCTSHLRTSSSAAWTHARTEKQKYRIKLYFSPLHQWTSHKWSTNIQDSYRIVTLWELTVLKIYLEWSFWIRC